MKNKTNRMMPHDENQDLWNQFSRVHFQLPDEMHRSDDDDWAEFEAVNDPASGKKLPDEVHGSDDDDWAEFEAVNDPASGKKLPDEVHGSDDDDWAEFEAVNDPASGKKLPDEVHGCVCEERDLFSSPCDLTQELYVTEQFVRNIVAIYGEFTASDDEYPAMGITIQGAPVFVECVRFPDIAVIRRKTTDEVKRTHPDVAQLWQDKLTEYGGRCRSSTVHIHPMGLDRLSSTDIRNFDGLRTNPDDPSTYPNGTPYPVILVNLNQGSLELLGFWVTDGRAFRVPVQAILDDSAIASNAWEKAQPLPEFTDESQAVDHINRLVSKAWKVEFGVNSKTGKKAIKAVRDDGAKVLIRFTPKTPFGLDVGEEVNIAQFMDWTRMLNALAEPSPLPDKQTDKHPPESSRSLLVTKALELLSPKNIRLKGGRS